MLSFFCKSETKVIFNLYAMIEVNGRCNHLIYLFSRSARLRKHYILKTAKCISGSSTGYSSFEESQQETCLSSGKLPTHHSNVSGQTNYAAGHKLVKVAVIGTPNAGKSTFVNRLVERRVCSSSSKVHTTRTKSKAILNEGLTQIIFLDTPGLVNAEESKRHHLEKSFLVDAELCTDESDLVIVIHDASNSWTRDSLDAKVLKLLHLNEEKTSILVMNKVDKMKSKRKLLDLSQSLTCGSLRMNPQSHDGSVEEPRGQYHQLVNGRSINSVSEREIEKVVREASGWPYFGGVFMISALTGSGIEAVKEYILQKGISRPWIYQPSVFTDQKSEGMIVEAVREKLLEYLPQEVPYNVLTELEHMAVSPNGDISAIVLINCAHLRHEKMVVGTGGRMVREIARAAEHALETTFFENVKLKIVVQHRK